MRPNDSLPLTFRILAYYCTLYWNSLNLKLFFMGTRELNQTMDSPHSFQFSEAANILTRATKNWTNSNLASGQYWCIPIPCWITMSRKFQAHYMHLWKLSWHLFPTAVRNSIVSDPIAGHQEAWYWNLTALGLQILAHQNHHPVHDGGNLSRAAVTTTIKLPTKPRTDFAYIWRLWISNCSQ